VHNLKEIVFFHAAALWRRRWHAIGVAWFICVVGWTVVGNWPDSYESKGRIYVDTDTMLRPLLRGLAIDTNIVNEVDLMQRTLLSRPNLLKIARMADLDLQATTVTEQDRIVANLESRIRIVRQGTNLFAITYQSTDPVKAKNVVQSVINVFVESNLGESRKDMAAARGFIDEQIAEYKTQLEQAEKSVAEFKTRNIGFLAGGNYFNRVEESLERARNDVATTEGELSDANRRRDEMKRQLAEYQREMSSGSGSDLAARVASLQQQLTVLNLRFTEKHPDVIETRRQLEIARSEMQVEQNKPAAAGDTAARNNAPRTNNPVYERLRLQLGEQETQIAALTNKLARSKDEVRESSEKIRSMPTVSAELARLTRDYEVIKRNYEELISRRESAKIGQRLDAQAKNVQFRLVDPPEVPAAPTGPNRPLFIMVVFGFGIGAGLFFAFFLSQIDNSIVHVGQLREATNLRILGNISNVRTEIERWRRRVETAAYGAACAALFGAFLGVLAIGSVARHGV
jgi:polysaccharide chain length determinant protein (PEP-CTERM system associated)